MKITRDEVSTSFVVRSDFAPAVAELIDGQFDRGCCRCGMTIAAGLGPRRKGVTVGQVFRGEGLEDTRDDPESFGVRFAVLCSPCHDSFMAWMGGEDG